jgi:hypothetical protein
MKKFIVLLFMLLASTPLLAQSQQIDNNPKAIGIFMRRLVGLYHQAHKNVNNYTVFEAYLQSSQLVVFDDQIYREMVPLETYLTIFHKRFIEGSPTRISPKTVKIVEEKNSAGKVFFTIEFQRIINGKSAYVSMVIQADKINTEPNEKLTKFRVLRIINPDELKQRNENIPYIASISLAIATSQTNKLVAQNIGANNHLPNVLLLGGNLSLDFGIRDLGLLQSSRFSFNFAVGSMVSSPRTWEFIQTKNVTAAIPDSTLTLDGGNYYAFGITHKLYIYQSFLSAQDKRSWGVRRQNKLDTYFLTSYCWHNYVFKADKKQNTRITDLKLFGGTFMLGGGLEFWLKSMKYSFFVEASISKGIVPRNDNLNFFPQSIFNLKLGGRLNAVSHRNIIR